MEELVTSDRSPQELQQRLGIGSNLLAHHLDVLEGVGLISRERSSGDGRRRYVHLLPEARLLLGQPQSTLSGEALFVCTANSARSQLAAALWQQAAGSRATSGGTAPAGSVHPGAREAAERAGLDLGAAQPMHLSHVERPALVITVCDRAHEELGSTDTWLHWSIPDPVPEGTAAAFDRALHQLRDWIQVVHAA